jgi:hypothetical protein
MRKNVATAAMRASIKLHELVDSPSQTVAFDATRLSLGIAGIKPDETSRVAVSVDIRAGYILDLRAGETVQHQAVLNSEKEPRRVRGRPAEGAGGENLAEKPSAGVLPTLDE